jgi:hypothetical protein
VYSDVVDGVDVVYRVTSSGLKEDVVLRKRPPFAAFPFVVDGAELGLPRELVTGWVRPPGWRSWS